MWYFSGKGDSGNTFLYDGSEVTKNNPILDMIGIVDEVSAYVGLAISSIEQPGIKEDLRTIQISLSTVMGVIAGASEPIAEDINTGKSIRWLEDKIDFYGRELDNPKSFTFSGETEAGAVLDICRTMTRKMERRAVGISSENQKFDEKVLAYINRLSSFFYILRLFVDEGVNTSR